MNLTRKTAIVTGAARGIGMAVAKALAGEGLNLANLCPSPSDPNPLDFKSNLLINNHSDLY